MPLQSIVRIHWLKWGLFWGAWALLALWQAVARYLYRAKTGEPISWWRALGVDALDQGSWALVSLAAFWLATRFPLDRGNWRRNLTLHFAAAFVLIAARFWLVNSLVYWIGWAPQMVSGLIFFAVFSSNLLFYALMVGAAHGIDYYRRYREREIRTSQLEAGLARAELQVLKMQLHPHFLFNTLNTISALMHLNVAAADRMVARLGDLLRSTLETAGTQEVTLRDELAFLEPYLEIEQTRFGDRLKVEWTIQSEVLDAVVPHLILQPLIEPGSCT
jgi:two-component system LytT family sensor kinase